MAAAQLAMEPMPMLATGPMPMLAMGPMLAFWLRPSTCAGAHGAALQSTVPMLVLPHDRVDAYAKKLHDSELLLPVSLGESSKARKSERHPASALTATPHLRALYQHMRSGESSAWVFFCSPSLCEPTLLRALSIYYFLWNEVQDLLTHMKHDRDGHMLAQLRQSKGPSFIFMPRDTNPLHRFLAHIPVEPAARELRQTRGLLVATTLANFADDLTALRGPLTNLSDLAVPLAPFSSRALWSPVRRNGASAGKALFAAHKELRAKALRSTYEYMSTMESVSQTVDAAAGVKGQAVRRAHAPGDVGAPSAADFRAHSAPGPQPSVFLLPTLQGDVGVVWESPAVRLVRCSLPPHLFHMPQDKRLAETRMAAAKAGTSSVTTHPDGVSQNDFAEAAAIVALEKCATDPTYRAKLLEQPAAMDLTPRVEEWTPESAATAVGRELYKRQLAAVAPKTRGDSS